MNIEVTFKTFYTIFKDNPVKNEVKETFEKTYFNNKNLDQNGIKIYNFSSSKKPQYYLTDINA
jgi:hypothetical protein